MTKKLYLPLLMAIVVALFSSCKKMGPLSADYFTVTPQVLEAVGGKVPATINGKFPEKYFKKKAVVEVTPVLKWNGGEAKGQSAVFQGEKVEGNDQTISYKVGGSYTMKTSFDYVPEMAKSELWLEFKAKVGKKEVVIPAVKVADGVISTSELVNNTLGSANPALGEDAFQRIIKEKHDANIMFLIQQANIRSSELKTAKEFNKEVANINEAANKKISNMDELVEALADLPAGDGRVFHMDDGMLRAVQIVQHDLAVLPEGLRQHPRQRDIGRKRRSDLHRFFLLTAAFRARRSGASAPRRRRRSGMPDRRDCRRGRYGRE